MSKTHEGKALPNLGGHLQDKRARTAQTLSGILFWGLLPPLVLLPLLLHPASSETTSTSTLKKKMCSLRSDSESLCNLSFRAFLRVYSLSAFRNSISECGEGSRDLVHPYNDNRISKAADSVFYIHMVLSNLCVDCKYHTGGSHYFAGTMDNDCSEI